MRVRVLIIQRVNSWQSRSRVGGGGRVRLGRVGCRLVVVEDGDAHHALGGVRHIGRFQLGRQLTLPFVPPILKPDFHLRFRQAQRRGQAGAFRTGEVAFHVERRFELEHLTAREHRSRFLLAPIFVFVVVQAVHVGVLRRVVVLLLRRLLVDLLHIVQRCGRDWAAAGRRWRSGRLMAPRGRLASRT